MKAIALFSGGLDSTLALKLLIDQGIEVLAVNINTGFGSTKDRYEHMLNLCNQVGAELKIIDIESEFLQEQYRACSFYFLFNFLIEIIKK